MENEYNVCKQKVKKRLGERAKGEGNSVPLMPVRFVR